MIWAGGGIVGGGLSSFHFNEAEGTATQQVAAVNTFLDSCATALSNTITWETDPQVATLNTATGALEGLEAVTPQSGGGSVSGDILPPATQGVLKLTTELISNGRLVQGRLFLPGAVEADSTSGGPSLGYREIWDDAAAALIADANTGWQVWARTAGTAAPVAQATVWTKWGVLRSRRD